MKHLICILALAIPFFALSQPELGEPCEQEVDQLAKDQIPKALKAWKVKNYREVERYLRKAVSFDDEYADGLYLLGDLYMRKGEIGKTEALWQKVLEVCPEYKPELNYYLGVIYMENGKRDKATVLFENFLADPYRDRGFDAEVSAALKDNKMLAQLESNPVEFNPVTVRNISSPEDEYLASISPDQQLMFFTRRSKKVNRMDGPAAKVRMVEEFSLAERKPNGDFDKGDALPSPFNTSYNEGGPSITADNTELYFTVCQDEKGYKNCDIYYSEKDEFGYWTTPRSIGDHINYRNSWESQPSVSADGQTLYFTSNRDSGVGGLDIWYVQRLANGKWSRPQNPGTPVNTRKNEKTPFLHSDSRTLYFTSDGHTGLGGFDIFFAKADSDTSWQQPVNLGAPINTAEDDLGLFVSLDGKTGYFASNKLRTNSGGWDLYQFDMPEPFRPEEVMLISGSLTADNSEVTKNTEIEIKNLRTREITKISVDQETGNYAKVVSAPRPQEDLIVTVKKPGAAFSSKYISSKQIKESNGVVKAPLQVAELEVGKEYTLNDINFETNSYALSEASKSVIDEFIIYLEENPSLKADIQGHTDDVGDDNSNMTLSKNRAQAVYNYVVNKGVSGSRLTHHGYGETRPISSNETEAGRAANRRTVFVIMSR